MTRMTHFALAAALATSTALAGPALAGSALRGQDAGNDAPAAVSVGANASIKAEDLTPAEVRAVQQALNDEGYDIGVDGIWGPETSQAIRLFKLGDENLNASPYLDNQTIAALGLDIRAETTEQAKTPAEDGADLMDDLGLSSD
jgi:peptidoglycan hydrolase-like protein with peptidoglycan-binding domain